MKVNHISPIILGSGQFIGVNHLSHLKGADKANRFKNIDNVLEVISTAKDLGYGGIMFSTHPHSIEILYHLSQDRTLKNGLNVYPNLPYIQKYVTGANEVGMIGFVLEMVKKGNTRSLIKASKGVLTKNIYNIIQSLIDIELKSFKNLKMGTVFLHNVLTDIIVSLKLDSILIHYIDYIKDNYNVDAGFVTLNVTNLINYLEDLGIENVTIQAPINRIGFQMNPNIKSNIDSIENYNGQIVAMSTLAAGYLNPVDAFRFISTLNNVSSVIVGGSTRIHLTETYNEIKKISRFAD